MVVELTEERNRLQEAVLGKKAWRKWGPYLSERQWGTVREDYSANGNAWEYLPHDHARSRAYRWGEDGIAGLSDDKQLLCFALSMWNGKDPIFKERLFGLTGHEGNHGEDVKEYYFYLDNTPTHSYMKYLYKYPQNEFPYEELVRVNGARTRNDPEYELLDTGIFNDDRYYDIFVEYAKEDESDILIRITAHNRGPDIAELHLLPTLWFRNIWSWQKDIAMPKLAVEEERQGLTVIKSSHPELEEMRLYCANPGAVLFTDNETNSEKLFQAPNASRYVKDGINDYIISNKSNAINPLKFGTKVAAHYTLTIKPGESSAITLRLCRDGGISNPFGKDFEATFKRRIAEADDFYGKISPFPLSDDMRNVQRQAFAGILWNKQFYNFEVCRWLNGDPGQPPPPPERKMGRNSEWPYFNAGDIISMPDKWEFPWFASWDLGFHALVYAMIDPDFAKKQLRLICQAWYMSPSGQMPAYEWNFGDVNPPVLAWAAMRIFQIESLMYGVEDRQFLKEMFNKLSLNFTWWINRKDAGGRNIFEGGFLGLDNIGAFDRSKPLSGGAIFEQPDSTGWMGMYCLNLLQIALELSTKDPSYQDMAVNFFEHFIYIADAINNVAGKFHGLWDEALGLYSGQIRKPDGKSIITPQQSLVGVVPLYAVAASRIHDPIMFNEYRKRFNWFIKHKPELLTNVGDWTKFKDSGLVLLSFVTAEKLKAMLKKILDEDGFLSPHGMRSVSRYHLNHPCILEIDGISYRLDYEPAESTIPLFGGNSNWRGPVWFPTNYLFIESLQKYHYYFGDDFKVECPVGSGKMCTLWDVGVDLSSRLISIFLKDKNGRRPLYGSIEKFQTDPHWKDYILFHEYFNGDNGAGLGACNQTGWTAIVVKLIHQYGKFKLMNEKPGSIEEDKVGYL